MILVVDFGGGGCLVSPPEDSIVPGGMKYQVAVWSKWSKLLLQAQRGPAESMDLG